MTDYVKLFHLGARCEAYGYALELENSNEPIQRTLQAGWIHARTLRRIFENVPQSTTTKLASNMRKFKLSTDRKVNFLTDEGT